MLILVRNLDDHIPFIAWPCDCNGIITNGRVSDIQHVHGFLSLLSGPHWYHRRTAYWRAGYFVDSTPLQLPYVLP